MLVDVRTEPRPGPRTLVQIFGFGGGMMFYALHLLIGTPLVALSCEIGSTWPVHVASGVAVAGILAAGIAAWAVLRAGRADAASRDRRDEPLALRRGFLGATGLMLNALALVIVVWADIPNQVLSPCLP
jgi:hypothetical protein